MLRPASIGFGALLIGQLELTLALGVSETLPKCHGEFSPVAGGQLEEVPKGAGRHDRILPVGRSAATRRRRLAHHYIRGERAGHVLQTTALINEAYLRLAGVEAMRWRDRAHFVAMTATLMRRGLVDYMRHHGRDKRGGGSRPRPSTRYRWVGTLNKSF